MNIHVQVLVGHILSFFLGKYLKMKWVTQMVSICLPFWKTTKCFPRLHHFIFPLALYKSSSLFTSSPILVIVSLLNFSHTSRCVMVSHCDFNLHSWNANLLNIHSSGICHPYILFGEVSVHVVFWNVNWVVCFLIVEFWEFWKIYSRYKSFFRYMFCKYFLPVSGLSFHSLYRVFWRVCF